MATKQRKIEINYRLLQTSCNIEVVGSVPDMQVYQADKAEYTPDYTLTPLVLFPRCNATDPEAVTKIGAVNSRLTNMKWYERLNGVRTLITSANKSYVITETGAEKGKIQVTDHNEKKCHRPKTRHAGVLRGICRHTYRTAVYFSDELSCPRG